MKTKKEKQSKKPLRRVFQSPGCVVRAKIKRIRAHLESHTNDRAARMRLEVLEQALE